MLAAGGTGGHLFPARGAGRRLVAARRRGALVTDRRADAFAAAVPGVDGRSGSRRPARRRSAASRLRRSPSWRSASSRRAACCAGSTPAAVVGFGGYPSVPTMLAAAQLGLPTADPRAERRARPRQPPAGAARRGGSPPASPTTRGLRPADRARAVYTGNPVRPAIRALAARRLPAAAGGAPIELLVLGGSQGARIFAEIVPPALAALPAGAARAAARQPAGAAARTWTRSPRSYRAARHRRRDRELLHRHAGAARARASGDLPRRRLDRRRARRRRPAGDPGALSARHRRSPDRQCRAPSPPPAAAG